MAPREVGRPPTDDWTVGALCHASSCLSAVLGLAGGAGLIVGPAVALGLHLGYRARSRFVAVHVLQAFAYQAASLTGLVGGAVLTIIIIASTWGARGLVGERTMAGAESGLLALAVTLVLLITAALGAFVYHGYKRAHEPYKGFSEDEIFYTVAPGASSSSIAEALQKMGVIERLPAYQSVDSRDPRPSGAGCRGCRRGCGPDHRHRE